MTQPGFTAQLAWPAGVEVIGVPEEAPPAGPLPETVQAADDLAYVIFTSGSTGLPKGVMIDHRGAVNTVFDVNQRYRVGAGRPVLALSALNFDLSVYDIFGLLAAGGAWCCPAVERSRDPAMARAARRERVTLWNSVPALLAMLIGVLRGTGRGAAGSLRLVAAQRRLDPARPAGGAPRARSGEPR